MAGTTTGRKLFVGLGNPGEEYENTYHNAGFLALQAIREQEGKKQGEQEMPAFKKYKKIFDSCEIGGIVFVKPLTYMNESGRAVKEAVKKFGLPLVVLHDDSDLTLGNFKIAFGRGAAGHHGVESIIDALRTNAFTRVRIGIRPPREIERKKAGEFALKQITSSHRKILDGVFEKIGETLEKSRE